RERAGTRAPEEAQQGRKVLADRRREMPGVAPARAGAGEVRLEQHGVDAGAPQRERRREPRVACPDDRHVGVEIAGERLPPIRGRLEIGAVLDERHGGSSDRAEATSRSYRKEPSVIPLLPCRPPWHRRPAANPP